MTGIHSFWTAPRRVTNKPLAFSRLEVLVWIYGALTFRARNGPIWLYTDPAGRDYVAKIGVGAFYEKIIMLPGELESSINPLLFWAASKLIGLSETPCPCINLDFDAVLFQKMKIWAYVVCGHTEPADWDYYHDCERLYRGIGLQNFGSWGALPVNASVVGWRSNECRLFYAQTAISFMERFSSVHGAAKADPEPTKINPMVFAEQKLLGMCMARLGHSVQAMSKLRGHLPIVRRPSNMYHLWACKTFYSSAPIDLVRSRVCQFLERSIKKEFPSSAWVVELLPPDHGESLWQTHGQDTGFTRTLVNVVGKISIHDPIFPIYREATEGCKMFWSEYLGCNRGARCTITDSSGATPPVEVSHQDWPDYGSDKTWETTPTTANPASTEPSI